LNSFYFIIPIGLLFGSISSASSANEDLDSIHKRNSKIVRIFATFSRLIFFLLFFGAFGLFGNTIKIGNIDSPKGKLLVSLMCLSFLVALMATILELWNRNKDKGNRPSASNRLSDLDSD